MSRPLTREEKRREHAERILRTVPPERRRVLRLLADRFGHWPHVDWSRFDDPTPPPEIRCEHCGALLISRLEPCWVCLTNETLPTAVWRATMDQQSTAHDLIGEQRPREKLVLEYFRDDPNGRLCSRCGVLVPAARDCQASIGWRCLQLLAELQRRGYWRRREPDRICPDCGGPRPKGAMRCPGCAQKRRRTLDRARKRRIA